MKSFQAGKIFEMIVNKGWAYGRNIPAQIHM